MRSKLPETQHPEELSSRNGGLDWATGTRLGVRDGHLG